MLTEEQREESPPSWEPLSGEGAAATGGSSTTVLASNYATSEIAAALLKALQESYVAIAPPLQQRYPSNTPPADWAASTDGLASPTTTALYLQGRVEDLLAALAATRKELTAQCIVTLKQHAAIRALSSRGGRRHDESSQYEGEKISQLIDDAVEQATRELRQQLCSKEDLERVLHVKLIRTQSAVASLQTQLSRIDTVREVAQLSQSQRMLANVKDTLNIVRNDLVELKNRFRAKDVQCSALTSECSSLREFLSSAVQAALDHPPAPSRSETAEKEPTDDSTRQKHRRWQNVGGGGATAAVVAPTRKTRKKENAKDVSSPSGRLTPVAPPLMHQPPNSPLAFSVMNVAEETRYIPVADDSIDAALARFSNSRRNKILFTRIEAGVYLYGRLLVKVRFSATTGDLRVIYGKKSRTLAHFVDRFEEQEFNQLEAQTTDLGNLGAHTLPAAAGGATGGGTYEDQYYSRRRPHNGSSHVDRRKVADLVARPRGNPCEGKPASLQQQSRRGHKSTTMDLRPSSRSLRRSVDAVRPSDHPRYTGGLHCATTTTVQDGRTTAPLPRASADHYYYKGQYGAGMPAAAARRDRHSLSPTRLSRFYPSTTPVILSANDLSSPGDHYADLASTAYETWSHSPPLPLDPNSAVGAAQSFINRLRLEQAGGDVAATPTTASSSDNKTPLHSGRKY